VSGAVSRNAQPSDSIEDIFYQLAKGCLENAIAFYLSSSLSTPKQREDNDLREGDRFTIFHVFSSAFLISSPIKISDSIVHVIFCIK